MTTKFSSDDLVCPIDGQSDAIQKVSAIVNGSVTGVRAGQVGAQSLAHMLAHKKPVKKPKLTQKESAWGLALLAPSVMCAFGSGVQLFEVRGQTGLNDIFEIAGSVCIIVLFGMLVQERHKVRELLNPTPPSPEEFEHAIWEDLYYCHRHDVIFIPSTHTVAPPQQMSELLRDTRMALEVIMVENAAAEAASEPGIIQTQQFDGGYMV